MTCDILVVYRHGARASQDRDMAVAIPHGLLSVVVSPLVPWFRLVVTNQKRRTIFACQSAAPLRQKARSRAVYLSYSQYTIILLNEVGCCAKLRNDSEEVDARGREKSAESCAKYSRK